jgi:hypothetical protein
MRSARFTSISIPTDAVTVSTLAREEQCSES